LTRMLAVGRRGRVMGPFWKAKNAEGVWEIGQGDEVLAVVQKRSRSVGCKSDLSEDKVAAAFQTCPEVLEALAWALRYVRMPEGIDPEEFAKQWTEAKSSLNKVR
jgi:hypothetical protein